MTTVKRHGDTYWKSSFSWRFEVEAHCPKCHCIFSLEVRDPYTPIKEASPQDGLFCACPECHARVVVHAPPLFEQENEAVRQQEMEVRG